MIRNYVTVGEYEINIIVYGVTNLYAWYCE